MRAMKDSGIEWIGKIPKDWETTKISSIYKLRNEKVSDKDFAPLSVTMRGILPQLETAAKSDDGDNRKLVRKGDFAINSRSDRRGSCGISPYDGSVSLINTVLTPQKEMNPVFYNWLFHSSKFSDEFYRFGHGIVDDLWTTRWQEMKRIFVPMPPLSEQQRIADFLDEKCADIDTAISEAKASIEDYKLLKQSIITRAVTKGLTPNAEMKDSGIEWIGGVPKDWNLEKGKHLFVQRRERGNNIELQLLSPTQNFGVIPQTMYDECSGYRAVKIAEGTDLTQFKTIHKGDFCISLRSFQGGFEYSEYEGVVSPAYQVFYAIKPLCDKYYKHLFKDKSFIEKMNSYTMTLRDGKNIAFADFANTIIPFPPISEQNEIAEYIDDKCAKIDALVSEKEQIISELEAYKKSLIFEYVTGKKEVA